MTKNENKLLDLFNEYNCQLEMTEGEMCDEWNEKDWKTMSVFYRQYICSKHFGFVKRLVDNDYIDMRLIPIRYEVYWFNSDVCASVLDDVNIVYIQLALQDNPIKYLNSILK